MTSTKKRKQPKRGDTVALKAGKITAALEHPASIETANATPPVPDEGASTQPMAVVLREEIKQLREQVRAKSAEYQKLVGTSARSESKTVTEVLAMLMQLEGATKAQLISQTKAKKGYVDALLSRILPSRGCIIESRSVEGSRTKAYFIKP